MKHVHAEDQMFSRCGGPAPGVYVLLFDTKIRIVRNVTIVTVSTKTNKREGYSKGLNFFTSNFRNVTGGSTLNKREKIN
jgi:hypothetical protein